MINTRYLKGAVPIRSIIFAVCIMALMFFAVILTVGTYSLANGLPLNATISPYANSVIGSANNANPSSPNAGLFQNYGNLTGQFGNQSSQLHNSNLQFGLFNTIGIVAQFFTSIGPIVGGFLQFLSVPLQAIGIPTYYATVIIATLLIGLIVLAIVSAIFLFPI